MNNYDFEHPFYTEDSAPFVASSDEWVNFYNMIIMDPDGWDRKNFEDSWKEKITWKEFVHRAWKSTCGGSKKFSDIDVLFKRRIEWIDKCANMEKYLSRDVKIDLYNCDPIKLDNKEYVADVLGNAARLANCNIISEHFHEFEPHGISGVLILAESHVSYHGWSEKQFCAIDLFHCSVNVNERLFIDELRRAFSGNNDSISLDNCKIQILNRGFFPDK